MLWRWGWLLNSLKYLVEKELRSTVYKSDAYIKNKWGFIERQVVLWSTYVKRYIFMLLLSISLLTVLATVIKSEILAIIPGGLVNWAWIADWQPTLLSAQLTIIGLIFPLVIGLVGFLLQSKTASKAIWAVYNRYSGFLFSGFSGLLLSIFILSGKYFDSIFSWYSYQFHCALTGAWFTINIFLAGWFLYSTFLIIQERSRDKLLLRYTINESFFESIRKRLYSLIPKHAVERKLIYTTNLSKAEISTFRYGIGDEVEYAHKFKTEKYLSNIYFRILGAAVNCIMSSGKIREIRSASRLTIPSTVDNFARKKHTLAVSTGFKLNWFEKILLRASYGFSSKKPSIYDELNDIIYSLVGSASDELNNKNPKLFGESIDRLANWHCEVSDALSFVNDDSKADNWLLLPSADFSSRNFLEDLLREYFILAKQSVSQLHDSADYFEEIAHLHHKIYNWGKSELPATIIHQLIKGNYLTWVALMQSPASTTLEPGTSIYSQHEGAIISYVGAWESWPMYLEPRSNRWSETINSAPHFVHHLRSTGQVLVTALRNNNALAAKWAADMLVHWYSIVSTYQHHHYQYLWLHEILTPNILDADISSDIWKLILNHNEYGDSKYEPSSAAQLALENAWIDLRIVCACYIASKSTPANTKLANEIADMLIRGGRYFPTGDSDLSESNISTGADIVSAYIRQRCYWDNGNNNYGAWIDSVIDAFNRIDQPNMVSGRIYSTTGARDVRSLNAQYVRFAVNMSNSEWALSNRWMDILFSEPITSKHRDSLLLDLNEFMTLASKDSALHEGGEHNLRNFTSSLEKTIRALTSRNNEQIRAALIDQERLLQFGKSASKTGFSGSTGGMPIALFKNIRFTHEAMQKRQRFTININNYAKSNISQGVDVNRAINENEWLDNAISQSVSNNLFIELCRLNNTSVHSFDDNHDLLRKVSADIRSNMTDTKKYILFISQWSLYRTLSDIAYKINISEDLNVERRSGFAGAYVCHLDGCPVYRLPFRKGNFSLLVPENLFDSVTFTRFDEDRFVDIGYKDFDENTLKLTLTMTYYMKPEFTSDETYRYTSSDEEGN